jgi:hypothetical protein
MGLFTGAAAAGTISPSEGAALATLMNSYARAIDMADVRKEAGYARGPTKRGARTMSQARFRRIARLEKLAHPYLEGRRHAEQEWKSTLRGAVANAAILAFLVRYGNPIIDEPLSCACQRCGESSVWRELADKFPAALLNSRRQYTFEPHNRDGARIIGAPLRRLVISLFPGADEKEKLDAVFASAPPWLIWFTFGDYTAELLGLTLPDLSSVTGYARSKENFDRWWGLPNGAFERRPWRDGPDSEPLAHTDLNLLRPAVAWPDSQMTRRERKRARATYMKSDPIQHMDNWPGLFSLEQLDHIEARLPCRKCPPDRSDDDDFHNTHPFKRV